MQALGACVKIHQAQVVKSVSQPDRRQWNLCVCVCVLNLLDQSSWPGKESRKKAHLPLFSFKKALRHAGLDFDSSFQQSALSHIV